MPKNAIVKRLVRSTLKSFKSDIVKTIITTRSSKANKFLMCCWIVQFLNLEFELSDMRISVKLTH